MMPNHADPTTVDPEEARESQLTAFIRYCEQRTGCQFPSYAEFEKFSIERYRCFWACFLDWAEIRYQGDPTRVCTSDDCEKAVFFPDLKLNFVDNLLRVRGPREGARPALTSCGPGREPIRLTRGQLRSRVAALGAALRRLGVQPGSRVALVAQNDSQAVIAAFGAASVGALMSTGSTELAAQATISRLEQVLPTVLFCHLSSPFPSVEGELRQRIVEIVGALPSLKYVVGLDGGTAPDGLALPVVAMDDLIAREADVPLWPLFPFNHAHSVLFTSGTSGKPKCVVHGAGGVLLEHLKCHRLHMDIRPDDRVFFQTSTAWVIWQKLLSALGAGAEVVLNSGPVSSPEAVWRIVADQAVTVFGTSPAYLDLCAKHGYVPSERADLHALRSIVSMGAILRERHQDWVRSSVKPLVVTSDYGSTEINGALLLPNPNLPDHPEQLQSRSLGIDLRALRPGECGLRDPIGEAVIANPFPSRPLGFLNDSAGERFHEAYFAENPGYWTQGDLVEFTPEGGARLHGRSDGVLNIRGIRLGPAEIYEIVAEIPGILGALAVVQDRADAQGGERLVLLVTVAAGLQLEETLIRHIKHEIRRLASPDHVPDLILEVPELPVTHNGKLSERSAADAVNGRQISNRSSLRNPECITGIAQHPLLHSRVGLERDGAGYLKDDPTEVIVRGIWQKAFGLSAIGREDDFFDLGGNSLIAIEIFVELETAFGKSLPPPILYQAPTIAALADAIDRHITPKPSVLVMLKSGSGPAGALPLFIVHGAGGSVMELRRLASSIEYSGAIIAIQGKGLSGEAAVAGAVDEMARDYVEAIRSVRPRGPYLLAGYSLGGLVALEMTRLLLAAREAVRPVLLIDTPLSEKVWPASVWLRMLWRRSLVHLSAIRGVPLRRRFGRLFYGLRLFVGHVFERCDPNGKRSFRRYDGFYLEFLGYDIDKLPREYGAAVKAGFAACGAYRPRFLDHPVHLLRAQDGIYPSDPTVIWRRFVSRIEIEVVPGDHQTVLLPPGREALASAISRFLERREPKRADVAETSPAPASSVFECRELPWQQPSASFGH